MDTNSSSNKKSDLQTLQEAGSALKGKYEDFVKNKPTVEKTSAGLLVLVKWCVIAFAIFGLAIAIFDVIGEYKDSKDNKSTGKIPSVELPSIKIPKVKIPSIDI